MNKKGLIEIIEDCVYNSQVLTEERVCFSELRKELNKELPEQLILSSVSHHRELLIAFSECVVKGVTKKGHEEVVDYFLNKQSNL